MKVVHTPHQSVWMLYQKLLRQRSEEIHINKNPSI